MGGVHEWGCPIAGWSRMENPAKMDVMGYPHFRKGLICINHQQSAKEETTIKLKTLMNRW
jgi:hypothetical protein